MASIPLKISITIKDTERSESDHLQFTIYYVALTFNKLAQSSSVKVFSSLIVLSSSVLERELRSICKLKICFITIH